MNARVLFRVAAIVALLQWAAHTTLFLRSSAIPLARDRAVIDAMKAHQFQAQIFTRSYWDFYYGSGLMVAFVVLIEAILFSLLAKHATTCGPAVRVVAGMFIVYNVGHALLAWRYFFITPMVPDLVIALLLAAAVAASIRSPRPAHT